LNAQLPDRRDADPPQTVRLGAIQALRAWAAIGVVIGHALFEADANFGIERSHLRWTAGTHLFFVISGFIMAYTNADAFGRDGTAWHFLVRRFRRIVPLYWLFTTLVLATLLAGHSLRSTFLDWPNVAASYLFWPAAQSDGAVRPLLSVGWTMNYAMFAAVLLLPRERALLVLTAIMLALVGAHAWIPDSWIAAKFWSDPIILEFLAGVFLGYLFTLKRDRFADPAAACGLLAIGFAGLFILPTLPLELGALYRLVIYGLPSVLIVGAAALLVPAHLDRRVPGLVLLLGDASYALYLSHRFTLRLTSQATGRLGLANPDIQVLIAVIACIAAGVAVHLWIEKPLLRLLQHRRQPVVELAP
jgi:exopolysaccharide production protein ExoZ